jgi:hypothetical protein
VLPHYYKALTTYDIAGWVYRIKPNRNNIIVVDDAQYVAVKARS